MHHFGGSRSARLFFVLLITLGLLAFGCNAPDSRGADAVSPKASQKAGAASTPASPSLPASTTSPLLSSQMQPGSTWWNSVQSSIAASEHHFRAGAGGFEAGNRATNVRAHFTSSGVKLSARATENTPGPTVRFSALGRTARLTPLATAKPILGACDSSNRKDEHGECLHRLEYTRSSAVTEWWENKDEGLEQGCTIATPPKGDGPLELALSVTDATVAQRQDFAELVTRNGLSLRYQNLRATDHAGRDLPAHFSAVGGTLHIVVDDASAQYPIEIDPVFVTFNWTGEADQATAAYGFSVGGVGDVNGDGFDDVIVGSYLYDNGVVDEGAAFVYYGSVTGVNDTAAWKVSSLQGSSYFGYAVAGAGDVNNDGYGDVIVGAYQYDNPQANEGKVFVYYGSAAGLPLSASWTAESNVIGSNFGFSVASAGDINNDGYDDVIIGALNHSLTQSAEGAAFVYQGSAAGLSASPAWTQGSGQSSASFGQSVSGAGDIDGDGYDDVIVGADRYNGGLSEEGRAYLFRGGAGGLSTSASWTAESNQLQAHFGYSVSRAGDVNNDGYDDVIVGAYLYDNGQADEGKAFLYLGSSGGVLVNNAWAGEWNKASAQFGLSVSSAGDVNHDGYDDVVVGAPAFNGTSLTAEGLAAIYTGNATGLNASPYWSAEGNQASAAFGQSVAAAGDVNGDGYGDVIIGAYKYTNGQATEGRAVVVMGSEAGPGALLGIWTADGGQASSNFGISVAGAGDVNGDGYDDILVGAYNFDNPELSEGRTFAYYGSAQGPSLTANWSAESNQAGATFGHSVASAGDVNNDGYDDVIIGAPAYADGEPTEGAAFVYQGSASGLNVNYAQRLEMNQQAANFGISVSGAGDTNNDGYDDVIVGADLWDNPQSAEGSAFVYLGSSGGIGPSPTWSAESDLAGAQFGISVGGGGDINGDGYDDVIVGANLYTATGQTGGRAYVYLGSASGPNFTADWQGNINSSGANFGYSVANAGDVNNDGYDDVIVGGYKYTNVQANEGAAWLFLGSPSGLPTTPAWSVQSDQASAQFGESVAGAGDLNNDGFDDVVVGASLFSHGETKEGAAFVYLGSNTGVSTTTSWFLESDQGSASFGTSVAAAGDTNKDGYADLLVGATKFKNTKTDEGRAYLFMGSACVGNDGVDSDSDGYRCPVDCNDANNTIFPGAPDTTCDGIDDDCSGVPDNDFVSYATSCGVGACVRAGTATCVSGSISDSCTLGAPGPSDSNCNNIDENCNGQKDEQYPATPTSCGIGACASTGSITCVNGSVQNTCVPGSPAPSDATCNNIDDDCNGTKDEDYVPVGTNCGTGACARTGTTSCVGGVTQDSCAPGAPAANDATCNNIDDDCDGTKDEDYGSTPTTCGTGACAATGTLTCLNGAPHDSCTPGAPAANDATCNNIDDDCDGAKDEDYSSTPTACGTGACAALGTLSCVNGSPHDSCTPGTPAANDPTCNNVDDDCDGSKDEDYVSVGTSCGFGACARTGSTSCVGGVVQDSCSPGAPLSLTDATCDGIDDDCDGIKDEDYVQTPTSCGAGACAAAGVLACVNGSTHDTCVAGTQAPNDATCNGVDDDCDGTKDEDYVSVPTTCGVGACVAGGNSFCLGGSVQNGCTPGTPAANDATCDNTDDDCDGQKDEDFVQTPTTCGTGACGRTGHLVCNAGSVSDTCTPGAPAANDATCDGIDDDCSGQKDEDYVAVGSNCGVGACASTGLTSCVGGVVQPNCTPGAPAPSDTSCNNTDDDCDGTKDEDFVQSGTTCGVGACASTGHLACNNGSTSDTCAAGTPAPNDATCNNIDDDCSGQKDEDYVSQGTSCGVGACARTGSTSCVGGSVQDSCSVGATTGDDSDCDGIDDNCNGSKDENYVQTVTSCGVGACARNGNKVCVTGVEQDTCSPGAPAPNDATCNNVDEDCNGQKDEDYVSSGTTCGVGACARTGSTSCVGGNVQDSCAIGPTTGDDSDCDNIDDNCDGSKDENYVSTPTTCGVGACASTGTLSCLNGSTHNSCAPSIPSADDATCDNIDDNCNGTADEGYFPIVTNCGVGACASTGVTSCSSGVESNSCVVGAPLASDDSTCDGVDDDCDGSDDEDYVETPTTCGVGACAASGNIACIGGSAQDTCAAGTPAVNDGTCDGVDDDCDGSDDEDYVPVSSSCGVGACTTTVLSSCVSGSVVVSCTPGSPTAVDDITCDGIDDNCNGSTDEDAVCPVDAGVDASSDASLSDSGTGTNDGGNVSDGSTADSGVVRDASTGGQGGQGGALNDAATSPNAGSPNGGRGGSHSGAGGSGGMSADDAAVAAAGKTDGSAGSPGAHQLDSGTDNGVVRSKDSGSARGCSCELPGSENGHGAFLLAVIPLIGLMIRRRRAAAS